MLVGEWMTPNPVWVRASSSVRDARRLLSYHRIRHLPVLDGGRVVGLLADDDVSIADPAAQAPFESVSVHALLGSGQTVGALLGSRALLGVGVDTDLDTAAHLMVSAGTTALPVVDRGRHLVGIITVSDCLRGMLTGELVTA